MLSLHNQNMQVLIVEHKQKRRELISYRLETQTEYGIMDSGRETQTNVNNTLWL